MTTALTTKGMVPQLVPGCDWTPGEKEQIRSALGVDGIKTTVAASEIITEVTDAESNIRGADNDDLKSISDQVDAMGTLLVRALGLMQENFYLDNTTYNDNLLVSGRIRIYSDPASVGTGADVIATYNITATYSGRDLQTYQVVKV